MDFRLHIWLNNAEDGGKYKIFLKYTSYNANDGAAYSFDSPQNYAIGTNVTGGLGVMDSEDWFRFTTTKGNRYYIQIYEYWYSGLTCKIYNWDLSKELYDRSVWNGKNPVPSTRKDELTLSPGTYYIKMTNGGGTGGKYIFRMDAITQNNCDHDYDNTYIDSTYFRKGYVLHTCSKCGKSYKDSYSAKRELSTPGLYYSTAGGKKKLIVRWSTVYNATGYQIKYSRNKNMKNAKIVTVKGESQWTKTIKNLSRRKKYYLKIRAYVKSGNKKAYSKWSGKLMRKTS